MALISAAVTGKTEVCSRSNWRCHAYCEMTNHFHVVVETADRRTVRATNVIGKDLELGVGVGHRVIGENQIAVGLSRVGLLGVLFDYDSAGKDRPRRSGTGPMETIRPSRLASSSLVSDRLVGPFRHSNWKTFLRCEPCQLVVSWFLDDR